jgi:hypothetical protein
LRVGCGLNDQAVILLQLGNPVLDVCGGVAVGVLVDDTGDGAKEGGSRLSNEFFFAVVAQYLTSR